MLSSGEPGGDLDWLGVGDVLTTPCRAGSRGVWIVELSLETRAGILGGQEPVDSRGYGLPLSLLDLRQGQQLGLRRVGQVEALDNG